MRGIYYIGLLLLLPAGVSALDVVVRGVEVSDWPRLEMMVRVTDAAGRPQSGVRMENLVVRVGDREAQINEVRPMQGTQGGMDLVLVIDASGTMRNTPIDDARAAVLDLLRGSMADDRIAVLTFNDDVTTVAELNGERGLQETAISAIETGGTQSVVYKAIVQAIRLLRDDGRVGRRAIVVLSDGQDESIGVYTLQDCIEAAREADIPVFSLGLFREGGEQRYLDVLEKLSENTGGRYTRVVSTSDLSGLYRQIYSQLRQFYMIRVSAAPELEGGHHYSVELNVALQGNAGSAVTTVVAPPDPVMEQPTTDPVEDLVDRFLWPATAVLLVVSAGGGFHWWYRRRGQPKANQSKSSDTATRTGGGATRKPSSTATRADAPVPDPLIAPTAGNEPSLPSQRVRGQTVVVESRPHVWGYLNATAGPHGESRLPLWSDRVSIGSRPANDIVLQDDAVSGQHAIVTRSQDAVQIADQESTNGTFVNGKRALSASLADGDRIRMGQFEYVLQVVEIDP